MKSLLLVFCIVALGASELRVEEVRALYWRSNDDKTACKMLCSQLEEVNETEHKPIMLGYKGGAYMMMANHAKDPFKKLSLFNNGKELLDRSIELEPTNTELHFLRFAVQSNTPGFLGYNDYIASDKKIILQKLPHIKDKDLQSKIIVYLLDSDDLSPAETLAVRRLESTI